MSLVAAMEFLGTIGLALWGLHTFHNGLALALAALGVFLLIDVRWSTDPLGLLFSALNSLVIDKVSATSVQYPKLVTQLLHERGNYFPRKLVFEPSCLVMHHVILQDQLASIDVPFGSRYFSFFIMQELTAVFVPREEPFKKHDVHFVPRDSDHLSKGVLQTAYAAPAPRS